MYYVYLIKSLKYPDRIYIGYTTNLKKRLNKHNSGESIYTAKYKPWTLIVYLDFENQTQALKFEKYLKSGSGRAFSKRRFL